MRKLVLGLAPVLLAASGVAQAQAPQWRISEVSGEVRIVENGRARAATRNALLSSGSTIATAARSRAVLVRGQEFVVVSPSSQLRLPQAEQSRGVVQMLTDWGTALFRIERQATPHFGVRTPYLAAVVKGTTFTVTVTESGASVQVTEGAVEVSTLDGGASELVRPGVIASIAASDLYQLSIQGDVSRTIRSEGAPAHGTVTVPAPQARVFEGPSAPAVVVEASVSEEPVSLADSTGGLVDGGSVDLAMVDVAEQQNGNANPPANPGNGTPPANPGNGTPPANPGNGTPPANPGNGNPPTDPGNGNGNPPTDPGNGNPPTDPGNGNGNPPTDPGNGNGNPPTDPGNGSPPTDPGNGNGNPPTDPGNGNPPAEPGNGNPPTDPGNGNGNPPTDPGNGGGDDDDNSGPGNGNGGGNDDDDDNSGPGNGNGGGNDDDDDDDDDDDGDDDD
jgi:collagen type III alpha